MAFLLAACATPQRKVTPLAQPEPSEEKPQIPDVAPPVRAVPVIPETGWIALAGWCGRNGLEAPVIKPSATQTNLELRSGRGTLVFEAGRRNVRWNGLLIGAGFPPQFTNGQAMIHALDLAKLVKPLLSSTGAPDRKAGGVVVIDPGHGGVNEGARSQDGKLVEKELTLDWAKRVERALAGSQWKVFLTRETDRDMGLTQRVAFAAMKKADLFISLHFNSYSSGEEAGIETYCVTPQGMSSHLTRGYADEIDVPLGNNRFDVENLLLAHDMHQAILRKTGRRDRGIRRARFMTVLREQGRPAVLLEGGYLSSPEEARLIGTAEFRQKLADAVAEALGVDTPTLTTSRE